MSAIIPAKDKKYLPESTKFDPLQAVRNFSQAEANPLRNRYVWLLQSRPLNLFLDTKVTAGDICSAGFFSEWRFGFKQDPA